MKKWSYAHDIALARAKKIDEQRIAKTAYQRAARHDLWGQKARLRARREIADLKARGKYIDVENRR